jgi:hypothetical protein
MKYHSYAIIAAAAFLISILPSDGEEMAPRRVLKGKHAGSKGPKKASKVSNKASKVSSKSAKEFTVNDVFELVTPVEKKKKKNVFQDPEAEYMCAFDLISKNQTQLANLISEDVLRDEIGKF